MFRAYFFYSFFQFSFQIRVFDFLFTVLSQLLFIEYSISFQITQSNSAMSCFGFITASFFFNRGFHRYGSLAETVRHGSARTKFIWSQLNILDQRLDFISGAWGRSSIADNVADSSRVIGQRATAVSAGRRDYQ